MTLAGVAKFVLGVAIAIAILIGGSAAVALYFMYRVATHPPKPIFANEQVNQKPKAAPALKQQAQPDKPTTARAETPVEETKSTEPLEPGTYRARVTWEQGLSLRAEPGANAERIGGLDYNQQIVVLEESPDKHWQKVRLADSDREGWIKAGNIEKIQGVGSRE
jgi:hypothetical protein